MKKPSSHPRKELETDVKVPRDAATERGDGPPMPQSGGVRMRDEDYTDREKPLVADSELAKRLHSRPPKGKEQLRTGTAGDAARPTKSGIHGKPLPPRGHL